MKDCHLSSPAPDRARDEPLAARQTGRVDQVAHRKIIDPVEHQIILSDQGLRIVCGQSEGVGHQVNLRVQLGQMLRAYLSLGPPHILGLEQDLTLQVRQADMVGINQTQGAHARCRQIERRRSAQTTGTDYQNLGGLKFLLTGAANFTQHQMAGIALDLIVSEHGSAPSERALGTPSLWGKIGGRGNRCGSRPWPSPVSGA